MQIQQAIEAKLRDALAPEFMTVTNESHMHSVPPNSETHFKVVLSADGFEGLRPVQRHQKVYQILTEELSGGVHALALHTFTPDEWQQTGAAPESPRCMGGSKVDG